MRRQFASENSWSYLIPVIIGLNIAVYIMWTMSGVVRIQEDFMINNFLISWDSLIEGRVWTLISSTFSHNMLLHLFMNMLVLSSFGPALALVLGASRFLKFYLIAGVISSFSHAAVSNWLLHDPSLPALGASGSISGVVILFSLLFPKEKLLLFGIIPMPALVGALLFVGLDVWGLVEQAGGSGLPIGHGAHLGGALTGVLYYLILRAQLRKRRRETVSTY